MIAKNKYLLGEDETERGMENNVEYREDVSQREEVQDIISDDWNWTRLDEICDESSSEHEVIEYRKVRETWEKMVNKIPSNRIQWRLKGMLKPNE